MRGIILFTFLEAPAHSDCSADTIFLALEEVSGGETAPATSPATTSANTTPATSPASNAQKSDNNNSKKIKKFK